MTNLFRVLLTTLTIALAMVGGVGVQAADPPPASSGENKAPPPAAKPPVREVTPAKPPVKEAPPPKTPPAKPKPAGIPEKVLKVLEYVDKHDKPMEGYVGGTHFGNFERRLPQTDGRGKRIKYREWDVNPRRPGVNRGAERMVTGSDGRAYYTSDHYNSFKKIR